MLQLAHLMLACAALAAPPEAPGPSAGGDLLDVAVGQGVARDWDRPRAMEHLVAAGGAGIELFLELDLRLADLESPESRWDPRELLLEAAARMPGDQRRKALRAGIEREDTLERRLAAWELCGATEREARVLFELAHGMAPRSLGSRRMQALFGDALEAVLERGGARSLPGSYQHLPELLDPTLVDVVVRGLGSDAVPVLLRLHGERPSLAVAVLERLARLEPRHLAREGERALGLAEEELSSLDPERRRLAVVALGELGSRRSVPLLIDRLELEGDERVRAKVVQALTNLTGRDLGPAPEAWDGWWGEELRWQEEELPVLRERLGCGETAAVLGALRTLRPRPCRTEAVARLVVPLLDDADPAVACAAARCLADHPAPLAVPALVETLERREPTLRRAAWESLRRMTAADLPLHAPAWRAWLDG